MQVWGVGRETSTYTSIPHNNVQRTHPPPTRNYNASIPFPTFHFHSPPLVGRPIKILELKLKRSKITSVFRKPTSSMTSRPSSFAPRPCRNATSSSRGSQGRTPTLQTPFARYRPPRAEEDRVVVAAAVAVTTMTDKRATTAAAGGARNARSRRRRVVHRKPLQIVTGGGVTPVEKKARQDRPPTARKQQQQ